MQVAVAPIAYIVILDICRRIHQEEVIIRTIHIFL